MPGQSPDCGLCRKATRCTVRDVNGGKCVAPLAEQLAVDGNIWSVENFGPAVTCEMENAERVLGEGKQREILVAWEPDPGEVATHISVCAGDKVILQWQQPLEKGGYWAYGYHTAGDAGPGYFPMHCLSPPGRVAQPAGVERGALFSGVSDMVMKDGPWGDDLDGGSCAVQTSQPIASACSCGVGRLDNVSSCPSDAAGETAGCGEVREVLVAWEPDDDNVATRLRVRVGDRVAIEWWQPPDEGGFWAYGHHIAGSAGPGYFPLSCLFAPVTTYGQGALARVEESFDGSANVVEPVSWSSRSTSSHTDVSARVRYSMEPAVEVCRHVFAGSGESPSPPAQSAGQLVVEGEERKVFVTWEPDGGSVDTKLHVCVGDYVVVYWRQPVEEGGFWAFGCHTTGSAEAGYFPMSCLMQPTIRSTAVACALGDCSCMQEGSGVGEKVSGKGGS